MNGASTLQRLTAALADRYRVDRELGAGGMAAVYLAHDLRHERDVAIKVLHPDLGAALGADRFLAEIKVTAKLQHPHILPLLDSGNADGLLYYVMPYVRGETLRARLARGPIPLGEATELLRNVLQALQYAHDTGIVHRDIKPENILLASGTAVVADFGIAKALSTSRTQAGHLTLTAAGTSVGTPAYMAPEQAAGDPHTDFRADLYAWGIVAYETLTGRHPFARHVTPQAMITAHMTETPPLVTTAAPTVPGGIAQAVADCLAKQPEQRPASAAAALAVFETYRTPTAVTAPAAGRPRLSGVLAALLVALLAAGAWWRWSRADAADAPRSLAVLPFDIGADTANAYLADGISAELTTKLSRIPGLVVRAYSSSKNVGAKDPQAAAKALGVATIVNATVRREKDRLHVNASLVAGTDARVLWSESFDERDIDQFALQDRLTAAIARALEIRLSQAAEKAVKGRTTSDPIAHDLVQRSRFEADHLTPESVDRAIRYANEAIARDSLYVDAWTALAYAYGVQADDIVRPVTILAPMQHAAERVAALDPNGADGHGTAGLIAAWYTRDSATADRELNRALQIDSTNGYALPALSSFVAVRHPDSSGALEVRALRHNPWSTLVLYFTAWLPAAHRAMSADTAVLVCGRLRQNAPPLADNCDALRLDRLGRRAEAQALLRRADTTNLEPTVWAWRGLGAAMVGDTSLARRLLARAEEESHRRYVREDFVAMAYAELGDRDQAFRWAVRAFDSRSSGALWDYQRLMQKFGSDQEFRARLNAAFFAAPVAGASAR